jgi:poly [ADP-ribose] polymerase
MIDYTPKHLVMVEAGQNRNKYYDLIPDGEMWVAKYGRVGSSSQTRTYSKYEFEKKYREKIRKGYVDQTDLVQDLISVEKPKVKPEYRPIDNPVINEIVERLQSMARKVINENYTVSSNKVTQAMVDEAQDIITGLLNITDVKQFNDELVRLFTTIPRKMGSVSSYIANKPDDFNKIIHREQNLLDVMKGQVVQKQIVDKAEEDNEPINNITVLEALGLEFEECSKDDIATIKVALGSCADKFHKAWKVKNIKTQARFDKFVEDNNIKDVRLLFHGSRNENWWSIIQSGLVLRPTNAVITGKMFGYGIYYAPKARKSLGYTSLSGSYWVGGNSSSGFMALMDVAYGKPYDVYSFNSDFYSLDYDRLQKKCAGANCLHAHAGSMLRNDEIVIYKEEQCTIKYLVELKN